jgi:murein endopeptidase
LQFKWFLIAAILGTAVHAERGEAGVPDSPLSLGYPNAGKLIGGRKFRETQFMVMVPDHANSRVRWALPAMISVLDRASRIVARKYPGSVLEIGELSRQSGGPITSHLSHQNGRDADVGFYQMDLDGQPVRASRYMRFVGSGDSRDDPTVRFDEKRNWAFVRAILEDPHHEVRQIFIYAPLRARLLAYAAKVGAPRELRLKAARAMMQPANALPHDDHFHVRISCPSDQVDLGCLDLPLWRAPGSPDEFGPDLLAEAPRPNAVPVAGVLSPYAWGRISKLWSAEQGVCQKVDLACSAADEGPACEDLGELGWPAPAYPPDEMGAPSASPPAPAPLPQAVLPAGPLLAPRAAPPAVEPTVQRSVTIDPVIIEASANGSDSDDPADGRASSSDDLSCAPPEQPIMCERPMTALVSEPESGRRVDRNVLE